MFKYIQVQYINTYQSEIMIKWFQVVFVTHNVTIKKSTANRMKTLTNFVQYNCTANNGWVNLQLNYIAALKSHSDTII